MYNKKLNITLFKPKPLNLERNKPILFLKKANKNTKIIPLNIISSDTGQTRHFAPAAQEWYNSVYAYNSNYIKTIHTADRSLMNLLKSYFSLSFGKIFLKSKSLKTQYNPLSINKIFVGKGELKHTSDKVVITLYVYNIEKVYLQEKVNNLSDMLFYPKLPLKKFITKDLKGKKVITYNRPFTVKEYLNLPKHYVNYLSLNILLVKKYTKYISLLPEYNKYLMDLVDSKILNENEKNLIYNKKVDSLYSLNYPSYPSYSDYIYKVYFNYLKELIHYICSYRLNQQKFEERFLLKLKELVKNLYNKEVEFNIHPIKQMHLNSDIFTQAVAIKLRNRSNNLHHVLKSSLSKVKIPYVMRADKKYVLRNKEEVLVNLIRNKKINNMFINENIKKDSLNNLLLNIFPLADQIKVKIKKRLSVVKRRISLKDFIFQTLKHMKISGIRIEAKGRLTKRFTASRSVFKMRWKGGLKNVDSSFKGLSAVMLRGHVKSNIQYSLVNSKTRNGAFGIKGWVSSK